MLLAVLGLHCCGVFPSLVVTVWATLHFGAWLPLLWRTDPRTRGLQQFRLPGLESTGSVVAAHRHLLHWQLDSFITEPPGEPCSLPLRFSPLQSFPWGSRPCSYLCVHSCPGFVSRTLLYFPVVIMLVILCDEFIRKVSTFYFGAMHMSK